MQKYAKKNKVHKFVVHKLVNFNIILEIKISISTPRWLAPSPGIASETSGRESSTIWSCRTAASAPEIIIIPLCVVVVGEVTLVFTQGIARKTLVVFYVAKPVAAQHLTGKSLMRIVAQKIVVLQYAPYAEPLVLPVY